MTALAHRSLFARQIEFVVYETDAPRAAENFRALCTGEKGVDKAGRRLSFVGARFYRILDRFIDQTGAASTSIYGGAWDDDPGGLKLKHDRPVRVAAPFCSWKWRCLSRQF